MSKHNKIGPIEIVLFADTLDNSGKEIRTKKLGEILHALKATEEFTDDMRFEDSIGNMYFIDDLLGKTVKVGDKTFKVTE
jgi:hypothetical protein